MIPTLRQLPLLKLTLFILKNVRNVVIYFIESKVFKTSG
jgi:hypothetical protein